MTGFGAESRPQIDAGRHPDATEATNVAGGATGVRCLVLVPRGERVEPILRESFAKRGISTVACDDPFALVARAVKQSRDRAVRGVVIVFAEPCRLAFAGDVVDSIRRYAPRAACWAFASDGAQSTLRAVTASEAQTWSRRGEVRIGTIPESFGATGSRSNPARGGPAAAGGTASGTPRLRLAGDVELPGDGRADGGRAAHNVGTSASEVLTPEELDLLLGDQGPGTSV